MFGGAFFGKSYFGGAYWGPTGDAPPPPSPDQVFGWITGGGRKEWMDHWLDRQREIDKAMAEAPTFAEHLADLDRRAAEAKSARQALAEAAAQAEAMAVKDADEHEDMLIILAITA